MRVKLYTSADMAGAMECIRTELGPEALILATRRVPGGVEVTAALEPEDDAGPPFAACDAPPPAPPRAEPPPDVLTWHGVPGALRAALGAGPLEAALAAALDFAPLALDRAERPLLLVGPPGAGKTLTAARLATRLVLAGTPPLVITADGQRAGAAEQLAAFTRLLGLSLVVASHPGTLVRALARRQDGAPVVIDGPGTDPFDPAALAEAAALAAAADASMALVLPAGLDPAEAAEIAAAFAAAGARTLIATRLDHARRLGGVLAAAHAGLALAEAGIGPGAADGLVPFTPAFLAGRLSRTAQPGLPA